MIWSCRNGLRALLVMFTAAVFSPAAFAAVWYVDASRPASGDGTSWATAFRTVQEGINAAPDGDIFEVWVKAGVYPEVQTNGGTSLALRLRSRIYGGFNGTETSRDQRDIEANPTILQGTATGPNDRTPTVPVVLGEGNSLLDGFTIRGGRALQGGGLLCFRTPPTIRNCTFEDNVAVHDETIPRSGWGGAVMIVGGVNPLFENCVFRNNSGLLGGAMALENGKPTLRGCRFENNEAYLAVGVVPGVPEDLWQDQSGSGGAIYGNEKAAALIERCTFERNRANTLGGAISFYERCEATVRDCVFRDNAALRDPAIVGYFPGGRGGAVEVQWDSSTFERCLFVGNTSSDDGGAIFVGGIRPELHPEFEPAFLARSFANPTFNNCIFLNNTALGTGGGVMLFEALATFNHCTFAGNAATRPDPTSGGGIHALWFSTPTLINSIAWYNTPYDVFDLPAVDFDPGDGNIISVPGSATIAAHSNVGRASSAPENMSGLLLLGEGNINLAPAFAGCDTFAEPEDVALLTSSPSLDAANPTTALSSDFFDASRASTPDMGAIEGGVAGDCAVLEGSTDGEGIVDGEGLNEGEGVVEGEGVTEGSAEGEGVVEGEGDVEGEGVTEGSIEGAPEGEGMAEGQAEGAVEGATEGTLEGQEEGVSEGSTEGIAEGVAEGVAEGIIEGVVEGLLEGSEEGVIEGVEEGQAEGTLEGTPEGIEEGLLEGSAEGQSEGVEEGSEEGQTEGAVEGIEEGNDEGEPEGVEEGEPDNGGLFDCHGDEQTAKRRGTAGGDALLLMFTGGILLGAWRRRTVAARV